MRVGLLGIGFMGWIHYLAYQRSENAKVVAFCSRDAKKRAGDWRDIQGNFGPPGEQIDISRIRVYEDALEMIQDDDIDLIDICLPPAMHVPMIRLCLEKGKKCFCEKPLALNHQDAFSIAREAGSESLMVAHILPLMNEYRLIYEAAHDGRFGKTIGGRFKRTIGPPNWIPDFYDPGTVGGPLLDLHVHDAHLIRLLFGMPTSVDCVKTLKDGSPKLYDTLFRFENEELVVGCSGGVSDTPGRPFTHGYEVQFEEATIHFEFAAYSDGTTATIPVTVLHCDGRIEKPDLGNPDPVEAFRREVDLVIDCVDNGELSYILDPHVAADAIKICEMQMEHSS